MSKTFIYPNKPQGVVDHRHFFPTPEADEADGDRYDACLLDDGRAVVWDTRRDVVIPASSWASAQLLAAGLASIDHFPDEDFCPEGESIDPT